MRASVACERCRSSKTKCVNDGPSTTCAACRNRNRQCVYTPPSQTPKSRRDSNLENSPNGPTPDSEAPRKRHKKTSTLISAATLPESSASSLREDPLSLPILTHETWLRLWDIFERHFYADLPFMHAGTFKRPAPRPPSSRFPPFLLLAFLALTAPFLGDLVKQHPKGREGPSAVGEYYYEAAKAEFGHPFDRPTPVRIQTQLMLGLYGFAHCRREASLWVGNAIHCAQILKLNLVPEKPKDPKATPRLSREEQSIEDEITRRTWWSCFIMDRATTGGTGLPTSIFVKDITIQLPCSEDAFNFGTPVTTCRLEDIAGPDEEGDCKNGNARHSVSRDSTLASTDGSMHWEMGDGEGALCHYIRAMEVYRMVHEWFVNKGRKYERLPPWDPNSALRRFDKFLETLHRKLPGRLKLNPNSHGAYLNTSESAAYNLIHMLHLICRMMPRREYVPANAINCEHTGPRGPLDPPLLSNEDLPDPNYWRDSACELFEACHDLTSLVHRSEEWGKLPETPLMMFGVYSLAQCGVYALHYDYMRVYQGYTKEDISIGLAILKRRRRKWKRTALNWGDLVDWDRNLKEEQVEHYKARTESEKGSNRSGGAADDRLLPVREGGTGGGAEGYIKLSKRLKGTEHRESPIEDDGVDDYYENYDNFGPVPVHALGKVDTRRPVEGLPTRTHPRPDSDGTLATLTAINGFKTDVPGSDAASSTTDTTGNREPSAHTYISPAPSGPSVTQQVAYGPAYRHSPIYPPSNAGPHNSGYPQYHAEPAGQPQPGFDDTQYFAEYRPSIPIFNQWHNAFPSVGTFNDSWGGEEPLYDSPYYTQYNQP